MPEMRLAGLRAAPFGVGLLLAATLMPVAAMAQSSLGLLNLQEAIQRTAEGQKLIRQLEQKYEPTRARLEGKNSELARMRDQLQKGANTMSAEAQRNLARDIERAERDLQRETEDARGEFSQEQAELFNSVGQRIMAIIDKYSREKGFQIVMDISNPQSPVLYAVNEVNITSDIIAAYDAAHPAAE